MGVDVALLSLITWIASICFAAGYALASWRLASPSTPSRKRAPSEPTTPPTSEAAAIAALQADQAALFSSLEKALTTVKRLSSRAGMRDSRERPESEPPVATSKADLLRQLGMAGKVGPSFARAQLELEMKGPTQQRSN